MKAPIAALALCLLACTAQAKPAPYRADKFIGDRYDGRVAQGASAADVVRSVRATRRKARHKTRRPRWAPPLTLAQGMRREAGRATGGRPKAWCGWWLGQHLGMTDRRLWLARNWASVGARAHGPQIGTIVVWPHHVGIITGRHRTGWVVKSGNDGNRVRERARSLARVIAYRTLHGST
jgi:hypothetical protein